jgi:hypothetical protein
MFSIKLTETLTSAQQVRDLCQTTQSMHAFQQIAILAIEVCASATPVCFHFLATFAVRLTNTKDARKKVSALAAHAVKRTDALITNRV